MVRQHAEEQPELGLIRKEPLTHPLSIVHGHNRRILADPLLRRTPHELIPGVHRHSLHQGHVF